MNHKENGELQIDGFGTSSGGQFSRVTINGRGKILSRLDCTHFSCNGVAHIDGELQAEKAEINGVLTTEGDFEADELAVYGKTNVHRSISANTMRVEGDVSVNHNCSANQFHSRGRLHINGSLQSENVQMTIYGTSRLSRMTAETLQIKRGFKDMHFIMKMFSSLTPTLRADQMVGNDIHLEYTKANVVRGKNISIGPGCEIDTVEYVDTLHQDPDAKVGHTKKVLN